MERLELSKQKLLEPKTSAVTNFATSVLLFNFYYLANKSLKQNLKIYSSTYTLYTKLVVLPRNIDFAKDKDF